MGPPDLAGIRPTANAEYGHLCEGLYRNAADTLDPAHVLNPGALVPTDPRDRR